MSTCDLCNHAGGIVLWKNTLCRVILLENTPFKGFCRVVLNEHVKEMTDLDVTTQQTLMQIVFIVEKCLRDALQPEKINLASLGNKTPHIHWHITPRFRDDMTFPDSIWSQALRSQENQTLPELERTQFTQRLAESLAAFSD